MNYKYEVSDIVWIEPEIEYTNYRGPARITGFNLIGKYSYQVKLPLAIYTTATPFLKTSIAVREDEIKYRC